MCVCVYACVCKEERKGIVFGVCVSSLHLVVMMIRIFHLIAFIFHFPINLSLLQENTCLLRHPTRLDCLRQRLHLAGRHHFIHVVLLQCTVLYCTVLYCTVLYCTVLHCTVLYCTVLYCTVLYCTVLYCAAL